MSFFSTIAEQAKRTGLEATREFFTRGLPAIVDAEIAERLDVNDPSASIGYTPEGERRQRSGTRPRAFSMPGNFLPASIGLGTLAIIGGGVYLFSKVLR